jgi:hypothetical protein
MRAISAKVGILGLSNDLKEKVNVSTFRIDGKTVCPPGG